MKRAAVVLLAACHSSTSTSTSTVASTSAPPSASAPASASAATSVVAPRTIALAAQGIGFDDLAFSPASHEMLVPAGATGTLAIIDTATFAVEKRVAYTTASLPMYVPGHHEDGVTSAAATPDRVLATDRAHRQLDAFRGDAIDAHVALAAEPDYVRYVKPTNEIWVTEPDASQIEIFSSALARVATIAVPGGPESLVVSESRKTAYANLWHEKTVEIDLATRKIKRTFDSGCKKTRGIALGGSLYVACNDGRVVAIELEGGKVVHEGRAGDGVDIIDFSPQTAHLYVPAARSGTLTVFSASLELLRTVPVAKGAHCVVADDRGRAWVCDPDHGSLVVFAENP